MVSVLWRKVGVVFAFKALKWLLKFLIFFLLPLTWQLQLFAQTASAGRHPQFRVTERMRPRVNFWIDIFAKYDQNQIVVHHRHFPGAVFQVLDFSRQAKELTPVRLSRYKDEALKREIASLKRLFEGFAAGRQPSNQFERRVYESMKLVPGGQRKFRDAVREDLIRGQTGIRCKFEAAISRSGRYMPMIEQIFVREHGLPIELTRLPFIESSFDYTAYSKTGAAGIWQFMPATARSFMRVGSVIDERRDPIIATHSAARYLKAGYKRFNSWPLAVTAYNHGAAGVARRIATIGSSDITQIVEHPTERVFGFASNNFYAELLAALDVYDQRRKYFPNVTPEPALRYTEIILKSSISAQLLSKRLGVDQDTLQKYNYAPTPPVWRGRYPLPAGFRLRLPVQYSARAKELGEATKVIAAAPVSSSVIYGGERYRVRKGDTLIGIARQQGVTVAELRNLNSLKSDTIRIGQLLTVSSRRPGFKAITSQAGVHTVSPGETLSGVAARHGLSVAEIKRRNGLRSDLIRVGQTLRLGGAAGALATDKAKSGSAGKQYRVQRGDTLWVIGKRFGVKPQALKSKNGLKNDKIRPGQLLQIP